MRRRGIALIIVVGVLAVLASIATAFVMMAELERKASRQRMFSTKAYLLARSGIEDALARLAGGQDPDALENRYQGEDWDALPGGLLSALEADQELFRPTGVGTPADIDACPLRFAMRPSFFVRPSAGSPDPALTSVDGRKRGYSGVLAGEDFSDGNAYALKVSSPSGFFVNGGDPASIPPVPGDYNDTLRRMLGILAEALDRDPAGADGGADNGSPVDQADGEALINARPSTGWASLDQIRATALGGSQGKLDALQPYLTLKAWVDKRVVMPNATTGTGQRRSWAEIKLGHSMSLVDPTSRAPDFERLPRTPAGVNVGRAPVYLQWARSRRPALIALLAGLKGVYLEEEASSSMSSVYGLDLDYISVGSLRMAQISNDWTSASDCGIAADAITQTANPLATWQDWEAFCDTVPFEPTAITAEQQAKRDILKANFNPNTDLNKFNPDPSRWKLVDKSDLLVYSTEFTPFPVQGREIESVGRVLGRSGRLLASRRLQATLSAPSVARISTQKEFACANLGNLEIAGDETGIRLPDAVNYLSRSQGPSMTWGSSRGLGQGLGLQVYPEPYVSTTGSGGPLTLNAADYDGSLHLATIETRDNEWYSVTGQTPQLEMSLARFDDGLDLDLGAGIRDCQIDTFQVTTAELSNSLWHATKPNTLHPDGAYCEEWRTPYWFDRNNANGYRGLMSFWLKNNFVYCSSIRSHHFVYWTNRGSSISQSQFWCLTVPELPRSPQGIYVLQEVAYAASDDQYEHEFIAAVAEQRHWSLISFAWDFQSSKADDTGELYVDSGADPVNVGWDDIYFENGSKKNAGASAMDITNDEPTYGSHILSLGWPYRKLGQGVEGYGSRYADATIDEFVIYDFGPGGGASSGVPVSKLAPSRWQTGRYYKDAAYFAPGASGNGEAGSWVSAPIALPPGSRIQKICWTSYRPAALPDDYPEIELLNSAANGYLWPSGSRSGRLDGQQWDLDRSPPDAFRLRAVFRRATAVPGSTPILDSPVLDDLTIVYTPSGSDSVVSWREP